MKSYVYLLAGLTSAFLSASPALAKPGDGQDTCTTARCQCEEIKKGDYINGKCVIPVPTQAFGRLSYKVVTAFYAPPGNHSTVSYGTSSSVGTRTETIVDGKTTVTADFESSLGNGSVTGYTGKKTGTFEEETSVVGSGVTGESQVDQPSHWNDVVYLWIGDPNRGGIGGPTMTVYDDGRGNLTSNIHPGNGERANFVGFTIGELEFGAGGRNGILDQLSESERLDLRLLNPWYDAYYHGRIGSIDDYLELQSWDSRRFSPLPYEVQVLGPGSPDGTIIHQDILFSYDKRSGTVDGNTQGGGVEYRGGLKVTFIVEIGVKYGATVETNFENVTENFDGEQKQADASIASSTQCWHQRFQPYYDSEFGTYAFTPIDQGSGDCAEFPGVFGQLVDPDGKAAANETLYVQFPDGHQVQTSTDANGVYRVFEANAQPTQIRATRDHLRAVKVSGDVAPTAPAL